MLCDFSVKYPKRWNRFSLSLLLAICFPLLVVSQIETQLMDADINNLAKACQSNAGDDPICLSIRKALFDFKQLEQRSLDYIEEHVDFYGMERYTLTGLGFLVSRKISFRQKSFFSDAIDQTLEFREDQTRIIFEYKF